MRILFGRRPRRTGARRAIGAAALCAACAACTLISPRVDESRFFVLTPLAEAPASPVVAVPSLGVGPVRFPRYLDRLEIVTRVGPNEVRPAVFDYWAASLPQQFETVLAQDLRKLLGADRIETYPWVPGKSPALAVEVDVQRFEPTVAGRVELDARWRIRDGSSRETVRSGESTLTRPLGAPGAGAAAEALSAVLADFGRELAGAIAGVRSAGGAQRAQRGGRFSK